MRLHISCTSFSIQEESLSVIEAFDYSHRLVNQVLEVMIEELSHSIMPSFMVPYFF